jgi:hypothetical protein
MVSPTIDPQTGRAGIGFEVAGIGKAGISIGADGIGGKLGLGPVSVGVGTGSASGFESLEWDFGVVKQKTTQAGCTVRRESWIVGVGVTESESWTDPRCEPKEEIPLPPSPSLVPPFQLLQGCALTAVILRATDVTYSLREGLPVLIPTPENYMYGLVEFISKSEWEDRAFVASTNSSGIWMMEQFGPWYELGLWEDFAISNESEEWRLGGILTVSPQCGNLFSPPPPSPPPPPPPSPPNTPPEPMDKACCAMLSEVHQVLAAREMLKGKCTFPWRLRMPGGQGDETIKDYANFLRALAQEIDHLGIHPPKLYIQDNNNAQEGDQTVDIQYPSATSAFEAMMKQVWDDNADGDTRTNFLYRLAWLGIQNSEMTLKLSAKVHALCEAFGVETEVDTATFPVPFNTAAGVKEKSTRGQGFGKNKGGEIDKSIDANTELAVEKLLPDFLKCRDNQVLIERYSGNKDMMDMLSLILMQVEKLNSK